MQALLDGLLPRILPAHVEYLLIPHEGKSDLRKSIPQKLKGWSEPGARFIIVCDQDLADCHVLKRELSKLCSDAGHTHALVRIVCRELEAWLFGDLAAVERGLGVSGLIGVTQRSRYRNPDAIAAPARQLDALVNGYQKLRGARAIKLRGARAIGPYLDPDNNRSRSFQVFVEGVRRMAATP